MAFCSKTRDRVPINQCLWDHSANLGKPQSPIAAFFGIRSRENINSGTKPGTAISAISPIEVIRVIPLIHGGGEPVEAVPKPAFSAAKTLGRLNPKSPVPASHSVTSHSGNLNAVFHPLTRHAIAPFRGDGGLIIVESVLNLYQFPKTLVVSRLKQSQERIAITDGDLDPTDISAGDIHPAVRIVHIIVGLQHESVAIPRQGHDIVGNGEIDGDRP